MLSVYCLLLLRDKCGVTVVLVVVTTSPLIQILQFLPDIILSVGIKFKEMDILLVILCSIIRSPCRTKKHPIFHLLLAEQNSAMLSPVK